MDVIPKLIRTYVTPDGHDYFSDWFLGLKDHRVRSIVTNRIGRVSKGNLGDTKSVGDGVFELRIHHGPGYRVYFGMQGFYLIVLLTGGSKSSQQRDIERAKSFWAAYRRRYEEINK